MRARILAWVIALTVLGMAGAGAAVYLLETRRIDARIDRSLQQEIEEFAEFQRTGIDPRTARPFESIDRLLEVAMQRNVPDEHQTLLAFLPEETIVPASGRLALHADKTLRRQVLAQSVPVYGGLETPDGLVRYATKPVVQADRRGTFVVAYFVAREHDEFADVIRTYVVVSVVALVLLLLVAWLTAGRLLGPVRAVRRTAQEISETDLTQRIVVTGNDDVSALAWTFNAMLDRIEEAFATQRRFLDDAGHELRTPITILHGHLELLDVSDPADVAQTRALLLDELDRMSRLVEDLVLLAKAARPDFLRPGPVDIGRLTDDVFDKVQALGQRRWQIDGRGAGIVEVDGQRLTQALVQLAENAVKFTRPDDIVAIGSMTAGSGQWSVVRLWVRDTGVGIADDDTQRIFERFQRGPGAHRAEGSGLGLAIVKAVAEAHRGRVLLESTPGAGSIFELEIPVAQVQEDENDLLRSATEPRGATA